MTSRRDPTMLWLTGAGLVLALALSAAAALSAAGPLFVGLQLIVSELRARSFRKIAGLEDLAASGTPLGDGLARVKAAEDRAHEAGARRGLARCADGFFLEDRDGEGEDLNLRLAHLLAARRQLAYDFEVAARCWSSAMAWRDVSRLAALLFIGAVIGLALFERPGAEAGDAGEPLGRVLGLAASVTAALAGFAILRLVSRSAAAALAERLWEAEPACEAADDPRGSLKQRLFLRAAPAGAGAQEGLWAGRNHYQLLGLDPQAEHFLIEPVYRAQMRKRHPDRGGDTAHAQAINEAYRVLRKPEARQRYDEELARRGALVPVGSAGVAEAPRRRGGGWARAAYVGLGAALVAGGALSVRAPVASHAGALAGVARAQTTPDDP